MKIENWKSLPENNEKYDNLQIKVSMCGCKKAIKKRNEN